jgi:hypothetical protein
MSLTLGDLLDLKNRFRDPIRVGELPFDVSKKLRLRNHGVYLSLASYNHIQNAHPDITDYVLLLLPLALRRGLIVQERVKMNVIVVSYIHDETSLRYVVALKIASSGNEVWVSSIYRSKRRQTSRILKRGVILKNHE